MHFSGFAAGLKAAFAAMALLAASPARTLSWIGRIAMRISGLVRWMRAALAGATVSFALPFAVMAQQADAPQRWGVNDTPQTSVNANGPWTFCMLWYGRSPQPRVNITLTTEQLRINLAAAELAGGAGDEILVSFQFPRGQTASIPARHVDGVVVIGLSEGALETVLHELQFNGTFTITANSHGSYAFPVGDLSYAINILRSCRRQLSAS